MNLWLKHNLIAVFILCLPSLSYGDIYGIKVDHKHRFELLTDGKNVNDLDYFLTAISTDKKNIWVNLRKSRPDKVISKDLANTRLGNTLLYADYKLKRRLIEYANSTVYDKITSTLRNGLLGDLNYVWASNSEITIVPKYAKVAVDDDMVVVDALVLDVELRNGKFQETYGDKVNHPLVKTKDLLLKTKYILPKLIHDVNYHEDFKELRTAYRAVVLAEWYKKRHGAVKTTSIKNGELEMSIYDDFIFNKFLNQTEKYELFYNKKLGLVEEYFVSGGVSTKKLTLTEKIANITVNAIDEIKHIKVVIIDETIPDWMRNMYELFGFHTIAIATISSELMNNSKTIAQIMNGVDFSELEVME